MSKSQAIAFFEKISKNEELAEKVEKVIRGKNANEAKVKELISLAKKHNFNFTESDVNLAANELKEKLPLESLKEVSGGKRNSIKAALMTLALFGGGLSATSEISGKETSAIFSWLLGGKSANNNQGTQPTNNNTNELPQPNANNENNNNWEAPPTTNDTNELPQPNGNNENNNNPVTKLINSLKNKFGIDLINIIPNIKIVNDECSITGNDDTDLAIINVISQQANKINTLQTKIKESEQALKKYEDHIIYLNNEIIATNEEIIATKNDHKETSEKKEAAYEKYRKESADMAEKLEQEIAELKKKNTYLQSAFDVTRKNLARKLINSQNSALKYDYKVKHKDQFFHSFTVKRDSFSHSGNTYALNVPLPRWADTYGQFEGPEQYQISLSEEDLQKDEVYIKFEKPSSDGISGIKLKLEGKMSKNKNKSSTVDSSKDEITEDESQKNKHYKSKKNDNNPKPNPTDNQIVKVEPQETTEVEMPLEMFLVGGSYHGFESSEPLQVGTTYSSNEKLYRFRPSLKNKLTYEAKTNTYTLNLTFSGKQVGKEFNVPVPTGPDRISSSGTNILVPAQTTSYSYELGPNKEAKYILNITVKG